MAHPHKWLKKFRLNAEYGVLHSSAISKSHTVAPATAMGKKRKVTGRTKGAADQEPNDGRELRTRLNIRTYEDVADSEDEFRLNEDRVLLEDSPARKRQRRIEEEGTL